MMKYYIMVSVLALQSQVICRDLNVIYTIQIFKVKIQ